MHGEGEQLEEFPQLHISLEAANELLSQVDISINECQTRIDDKRAPFSFLTKSKAEIIVTAQYEKSAKTMNVVGTIEGTDPDLKDEYLVIGAHLDHVGSQAGLLFPGANDNASGSAAILKLAEAFKKVKQNHRSLSFYLLASEEYRYVNSVSSTKHFVENLNLPTGQAGIDTSQIIAMLNLDCIGYGDSIQIGNGKSSPELWSLASKIDKENFNLGLMIPGMAAGTDLTPFYEKRESTGLYFVSKYSYDHLHLPTDTPETLNTVLFEKIVKLAYLASEELLMELYKEKHY
ncbi:MAG: M28 family peptidase [Ignavibacteriaceae bacterium]|nr:M28 family peptidase [Ignavibacteriaceae bacterium]